MRKWHNEATKSIALPKSVWAITKTRSSQREPISAFVTRAIKRELLREGVDITALPTPPDPKPAPVWQGGAMAECRERSAVETEKAAELRRKKEQRKADIARDEALIQSVIDEGINERLRNA